MKDSLSVDPRKHLCRAIHRFSLNLTGLNKLWHNLRLASEEVEKELIS
jgi:hypothetical protein